MPSSALSMTDAGSRMDGVSQVSGMRPLGANAGNAMPGAAGGGLRKLSLNGSTSFPGGAMLGMQRPAHENAQNNMHSTQKFEMNQTSGFYQ